MLISKRSIIIFTIKILFTLIFVVIVNRAMQVGDIRGLFAYLRFTHIIVVVILGFISLFFQVARWRIILDFMGFSDRASTAWRTVLWGHFLAFITPGRIGELFRGVQIKTDRKADAIFAVVVDKLFILSVVFATAIVAFFIQIFIFKIYPTGIINTLLWWSFAICVILILFLLAGGKRIIRKKTVPFIDSFFEHLPYLLSPAGCKALFYSVMAHMLLIIQTVILFEMFGLRSIVRLVIAAAEAFGVMPFLPFFIANMGIREKSFSLFLEHGSVFVLPGLNIYTAAFGASLLILIINIIVPATVGMLWMIVSRQDLKKSRELV